LAVTPARLCTGWFVYWSIRYELCGVSARDEYASADFGGMHGAALANLQR